MNKLTKILVATIASLLVLSLGLLIYSCSKNKDSGTENDTPADGDNVIDVEIGEDDVTENEDGTIDIEINLGDINMPDVKDPFDPDDGIITYEEYWSWTTEEREAYFNSFDSTDEFFEWYNGIVDEYNNRNDAPVIGENGEIDLGGY